MKLNVTIPDGPMADALRDHATQTERTPANLCRYAIRILLNKHGYRLPAEGRLQTSARANGDDPGTGRGYYGGTA